MRKLRKIIADWAAWGVEAQKTIAQKDVEINKQGAENRRLGGELNNLHEQLEQSGPSVFAAEAEHLREENRRWQVAYANLQGSINAKDAEISDLKARNQQLKKEKATLGEQLEASEGENIYVVEMEELLERINDSSNTDYNNLSDAIDYLLEE
jgi:chromosome segregation ATPase